MRTSIILIISGLVNIVVSTRLIYVTLVKPFEIDAAYNSGYHDARNIYECDHDRTECEMLKQ